MAAAVRAEDMTEPVTARVPRQAVCMGLVPPYISCRPVHSPAAKPAKALDARTDQPPARAAALFTGRAAEVGRAREFVRSVLGVDWPELDDVLLLVSEIASNAVRHTASADEGGSFTLTITVSTGTVRVEVADSGSSSAPRLQPDQDDLTSGRGLRIVDTLASCWGHTGDELGRVVWFEMCTGAGR